MDALKIGRSSGSLTANHHLTKMDVLQKTFLQITLAAKWLVHPPTRATTFAFSSVFFLVLCSPSTLVLFISRSSQLSQARDPSAPDSTNKGN